MKKLTVAYKNSDLHTLLSIESELLSRCGGKGADESDLKTYNLLLKEQVQAVEVELKMLPLSPRYLSFSNFIGDDVMETENALQGYCNLLESDIPRIEHLLEQLQQENPVPALKRFIRDYRD